MFILILKFIPEFCSNTVKLIDIYFWIQLCYIYFKRLSHVLVKNKHQLRPTLWNILLSHCPLICFVVLLEESFSTHTLYLINAWHMVIDRWLIQEEEQSIAWSSWGAFWTLSRIDINSVIPTYFPLPFTALLSLSLFLFQIKLHVPDFWHRLFRAG